MNRRRFARFASLTLGLAGLWLVVFHVILFWRRIADATIQHPDVLARWIGSALLILGALAARRYALRHVHRRHITWVFWLVVLLLHVAIPAESLAVAIVQIGIASVPAALLLFGGALALSPARNFEASAGAWGFAGPLQLLASSSSPRSPPLR